MEKRLPLFYADIPIGFITFAQQGSRFNLNAECSEVGDGVVRAYACSRSNPGIRLLIGVMMPERGVLKARRVYTRNDLQELKILPEQIDMGEVVEDGRVKNDKNGGWVRCAFPQKLFSDYALKNSVSSALDILTDNNDNPSRVAARLGEGPFALAPAFCLVRVLKIGGKAYGVLGRDKDGTPIKIEKI